MIGLVIHTTATIEIEGMTSKKQVDIPIEFTLEFDEHSLVVKKIEELVGQKGREGANLTLKVSKFDLKNTHFLYKSRSKAEY